MRARQRTHENKDPEKGIGMDRAPDIFSMSVLAAQERQTSVNMLTSSRVSPVVGGRRVALSRACQPVAITQHCSIVRAMNSDCPRSVSYTHLTLPTNREV